MNWDELRGFRDERLVMMDKYQYAILWEGLTEQQKTELRQYRQDLLDLPQNYNTPQEAFDNLPVKPNWM